MHCPQHATRVATRSLSTFLKIIGQVHPSLRSRSCAVCPKSFSTCTQAGPSRLSRLDKLKPSKRIHPRALKFPDIGFYSTQAIDDKYNVWVSAEEEAQEKVIEISRAKVEIYREAVEQEAQESTVDEAIARAKILKDTSALASAWAKYQDLRKTIIDLECHLSDPDPALRELFQAEHEELLIEINVLLTTTMPRLLLPPAPTHNLSAIVSMNAGVGGAEACAFLTELSKAYTQYAEGKGWSVTIISATDGPAMKGGGGFRELTMKIEPGNSYGGEEEGAAGCYGLLRFESGLHRVQRVPVTESGGRIQTSFANISVLPVYPENPDEPLYDPKDMKEEVMRARGAGGQHVNKTESAIRLTHIPTGITVSMQDSRSQHQNRAYAWVLMRARLANKKRDDEMEAKRLTRKTTVSTSSRSDRVRTYNFGQDRITDHRIGLSIGGIENVMQGNLDPLFEALQKDLEDRRLGYLLAGEEDMDD